MSCPSTWCLLFLAAAASLAAAAAAAGSAAEARKNTYIVHMADNVMPAEYTGRTDWYTASLRSVSPMANVIYSYQTIVQGFAAQLTPLEAAALESKPGVLLVNLERRYVLHTTRTPEYLRLDRTNALLAQTKEGAHDVIIGLVDSGVWPESRSFSDAGYGPVPARWKGKCEAGANFTTSMCNKKLIGARFFSTSYEAGSGVTKKDWTNELRSPRDEIGHGTHTASTAGGNPVEGAGLGKLAAGTARGMSPRARVAVYKACWFGGCYSADILMAMEAAVADGVDILSLSLGTDGGDATAYFRDSISAGAYNAMEKGVFVSCSAGNEGPRRATMSNGAPWITTVGASTIDRDFPATIVLGNGKNYTGATLYIGDPLSSTQKQLIDAEKASVGSPDTAGLCLNGTLITEKVAGKIVICDRGLTTSMEKGMAVKAAGGAGMVFVNSPELDGSDIAMPEKHVLPAAAVRRKDGEAIKVYESSSPNPTATIATGITEVGVEPSPVVAAFSSRGPNIVTPVILKPDLIAPGVNILAAWPGNLGPTGFLDDTRRVEFNILSGTSMSCPHVSGVAALLRAARPGWSPAAIRSALMTTTYTTYPDGKPIVNMGTNLPAKPFDMGAGHIDPGKALEPGLVYNLTDADYLDFLCALNYTQLQVCALTMRLEDQCLSNRTYNVNNFNYPSFSVLIPAEGGTVKHTRTLTNVGQPGTYKVAVSASAPKAKITVSVEPSELRFTTSGEQQKFTVSFTAGAMPEGTSGYGKLVWSGEHHKVTSPIVATWT